jgi:3-oxoadipate enol-lactonase
MRSGTASVNGARIFYEDHGSGRPLLFLHGFTLDRRMWAAQVAGLGSHHRVVAYDARGFGRSEMPRVGEPYKHCEDAAALCEDLGLERVIAVGHSIGAHQMLELALTRPDLVAGYVAVAPSGIDVPFPDELMQMFGAIRRAAKDQGIDAAKAIWRGAGWFASARENPELAAKLEAILADYSGWHWTNDNPAKNIDPPARARLSSLEVPTLVITGGRDLPYNEAVGDVLIGGIKGARALRVPTGGHMVPMENPAPVNEAIADLVAKS